TVASKGGGVKPVAAQARVLVFARGGKRHSVGAARLLAAMPAPAITVVPLAPQAVLGLLGWRGTVVPVVEVGPSEGRAVTAAVVVQGERGALAMPADEVIGWDDAGASQG